MPLMILLMWCRQVEKTILDQILPLYLRLSCYCAFNDLVDVVQAGGKEDLGPDPLPLHLRLSYCCAFNDLVDVVQAGGEEDLGPDPLPLYLRQSH
jgi:hypothetical protein